tara:strand:- start:11885 stop:13231 length:1347 start_codon:yes stop_codon:yes gene_type:complete
MSRQIRLKNLLSELLSINDLRVLDSGADCEKFSRDFFDYSPVLKTELDSCRADVVVRPFSIESVVEVVSVCKKHNTFLTLRGSGTGNYGQCVPLRGGVVMLMGEFKNIRDIDPLTGVVTVEPGCLIRDVNKQLVKNGRQLRLLPSTWRSASIGGFIAGGSGGIGSVRWGFLRDPGNLLGLEIVTLEDVPRKLELDANEAEALNHAYGTNGIITALKLATAPSISWQEITIDFQNFSDSVRCFQRISTSAIDLFLCSLMERPIVNNLPNWNNQAKGCHRLLILASPDGVCTIERLATLFGGIFTHFGSENESAGSGLRELTWNHTTLHMRAVNSSWTYLQMLLPQPEIDVLNSLKSQFGDDLLWHLEAVRQNGTQRIAALPLVKWRGRALLEKIINACKENGAIIFNPHVITVEDGGLGVIDVDQVLAKKRYDPEGILNPGKLKGWLNN